MRSNALRRLWNHRAILYRSIESRDEFGDTVAEWVPQDTPPGKNCRTDETWAGAQDDRGPGERQAGERLWFLDRRFGDVRDRDVLEIVEGPEAPMKIKVLSVNRPTNPREVHHFEINSEIFQGELTPAEDES